MAKAFKKRKLMATHSISRINNIISINSFTETTPGKYYIFIDGNLLIIRSLDGVYQEINLDTETVEVDGDLFVGTADNLKQHLLTEIFYGYSNGELASTPLVYAANLTSQDSSTTYAKVTENTIGPITFERLQAGRYRLSNDGFVSFTYEKTNVFLNSWNLTGGGKGIIDWEITSPSTIEIVAQSFEVTPDPVINYDHNDGLLYEKSIKIEVYP
jgi:hypothetical protein